MARYPKGEVESSIEVLKKHLKPGDTVYTKVTHVARSGMSRSIEVYIVRDGDIWNISYFVARACGYSQDDKNGGVKIGGCGMDMGYAIVYSLSRTLFQDNFICIGDSSEYSKRCPSNDHVNGSKDFTPHQHSDGGYALRHRWL